VRCSADTRSSTCRTLSPLWNRTPPHPSHPFNHGAAPFAAPIRGLHMREIDGSAVFRHFFGRAVVSH
jgi:hypothetical protein